MPQYIIEENSVAKYLTDDERKERGFMKGDCINATMEAWKDLTNKFGNHFEIVYIILDRKSCSIVRLMNEKEIDDFYDFGKYQGHFLVYNTKTKTYIDKSNGQSIISNEKEYLVNFNNKLNKYVWVCHIGIEFMYNQTHNHNGLGNFMCDMLRNYKDRLPTHREEVRWKKEGMKIIKKYPF